MSDIQFAVFILFMGIIVGTVVACAILIAKSL